MIAVFDSGLGGLCALRALRERLPREDILYFGDTARLPYGDRSKQTLLRFTRDDLHFLLRFAPRAILAACGTVSSVALPRVKDECPVPLYGIVAPTARQALQQSRTRRIGVIGTCATVASDAYRLALQALCPDVAVFSLPCPLFVPLIENGLAQEERIALPLCEHTLAPLRAQRIDTLILGCTHYPLLSHWITQVLGEVTLIDAARCGADALCDSLSDIDGEGGQTRFFVSDDPASFAVRARPFLGEDAAPVYLYRHPCGERHEKRSTLNEIFS